MCPMALRISRLFSHHTVGVSTLNAKATASCKVVALAHNDPTFAQARYPLNPAGESRYVDWSTESS